MQSKDPPCKRVKIWSEPEKKPKEKDIELAAVELPTKPKPAIPCCIYNPPKNSSYRASKNDLEAFLNELKGTAAEQESAIVFTDYLNLDTADWESMTSKDKYEENVVCNLDEMNLQQNLPHGDKPSLDILLTQSPESIEISHIVTKLEAGSSVNGKRCSDHRLFKITASTDISTTPPPPKIQHAYRKTDWQKMNTYIVEHPITPYCYSHIDELVTQ